jgi:myo-inositol-1(or 4)-monophosphatase
MRRFTETLLASRGIRRVGAAALNVSYVAAGRLDGYFASATKIWDVAAGILLVQEAGGTVTSLHGKPFDLNAPNFVCACTPALHAELLEILARAE